MQNRNEFIQVSKVLLNNLIHSSSFGRSWVMVNVLSQTETAFTQPPAFNIQLSESPSPAPSGEEQAEVAFIWVNASTVMANEYSRRGKSQTKMSAAENTGFSESRTLCNSSLFRVQSVGKCVMQENTHTHV